MAFLTLYLTAEDKPTIAVMDLKITNVPKDEVELIVDFLNNALFETGAFDVIQKNMRNKLLEEMEFSASDLADAEKTNKIGKLLSAKLLLFGSIGKLGTNIIFTLTLVDVQTGKTENTFSKTYKKLENIVEDLPSISEEMASISQRRNFEEKSAVLYFDDFSAKTWPESEKLYYRDNKYHIFNKESDWYTWETMSVGDCIIEAETEFIDGQNDAGYGLLFRMKDTNNFYLFDITQNGYFRVEKKLDGKYINLIQWEKSPAINLNAVNFIKIEALGKHLALYINKVKVKEIIDTDFKEGYFGMFASKNVHASFDNLLVYQGNLVFFESFTTANANWIQDEYAYFKDGRYIITAPKGSNGYYSWTSLERRNFILKADVEWLKGSSDDLNYGVTFRFKDLNNHYLFEIAKTGYYQLSMYLDGKWKTLIPWQKSNAVNKKGKDILKVECRGKMITLFVNDAKVDSYEDDTFSEGKIGVVSAEGMTAAFDNIEVFSIK